VNRFVNVLTVGMMLACANARYVNHPYQEAPVKDGVSEATRACLANPAAQVYLREMHRKIIEAWAVKFGTEAQIVARLSINDSGKVRGVQILKSPTQELSDLATKAILSSAPFGSVPDQASCLSANALRLTFKTWRK